MKLLLTKLKVNKRINHQARFIFDTTLQSSINVYVCMAGGLSIRQPVRRIVGWFFRKIPALLNISKPFCNSNEDFCGLQRIGSDAMFCSYRINMSPQ